MTIVSSNIVYGIRLSHDLTHEYRYVGLTTKGAVRFAEHLKTAKAGKQGHNPYLYRWMAKHFCNVTFDILDTCDSKEELLLHEMKWIHVLRNRGHRLMNLTDGGEGSRGRVFTEAQRAAISVRTTGELNPMSGYEWTPEQRDASRLRMLGVEPWNKGKVCPSISGSGNGMYGRKHSQEVIDAQKERVKRSNHTRWHVNRGVTNPDCTLCQCTSFDI